MKMTQLCIFAGAGKGVTPDYEQQAEQLGHMLAARNFEFIYGGGRTGLMGAFAKGALDSGSHVTGIIPKFLDTLEIGNSDIQNLEIVQTMHERKARMYRDAKGFVILPGGLGTLDEWMEVMTWNQLGLIRTPIFVLNFEGYWQSMLTMLEHASSQGFVNHEQIDFLHVATSLDQLVDQIEQILNK